MDFEDESQKLLYEKCKYKVKLWEHNFKKSHGRLPSRLDIKEADSHVRCAYKTYFQIKTAILEQRFIDVDGFNFDDDESQQSESASSDTVQTIRSLETSGKYEETDRNQCEALKKMDPSEPLTDINLRITRKLSAGSKIIKRNPRKSLYQVKSEPSVSSTSVNSEIQISFSQPVDLPAELPPVSEVLDFEFFKSTKLAKFNSNASASSSQPINVIQKVLIGKSSDNCKLKNVDMQWLERVENSTKVDERIKETTVDRSEFTKNAVTKLSSDEDIIYDSDTEEVPRNLKRFKSSNSNSTLPKQNIERGMIGENVAATVKEKISEEVIKTSVREIPQSQQLPTCLASRTKNPNENFLKINLKKKIYARGKKTQTYSKFKKKFWKNKKKLLAEQDEEPVESSRHRKQDKLLPLNGLTLSEDEDYLTTLDQASGKRTKDIDEKDESETESEDDLCLEKLKRKMQIESPRNIDSMKKVINIDNNVDKPVKRIKVGEKGASFGCIKNEKPKTKMRNCEGKLEALPNYNVNEHLFDAEDDLFWETLEIDAQLNLKDIPPLWSDLRETPNEVYDALRLFGHSSFRAGQEESVRRIICGKSTVVSLSTGTGKSLCYQLPAYLYKKMYRCVTLVVSPLISLMEDQLACTPSFLRAACLHGNQNKAQRDKIVQAVKNGEIDILMLSPEAVTSSFGAIVSDIPPIAFACLDEAHCLSQWSHNFRPSYLVVCKILQETLGVKTILGLTATATKSTRESLVRQLNIVDGEDGVIMDTPVPSNLTLTVSKDSDKDRALLEMLTQEPFVDYKSIIIYCLRRDQCEKVATLLRTSLNRLGDEGGDSRKRKRKRSVVAEAYHAGLSATSRKMIQRNFMSGELRIVVATIAFGMGINKPDIRCVIHYNMPAKFESYVQEIGRAGRDGLPARCHVFLEENDVFELARHVYSNTVDRHVIRKLLRLVFVPCSCADICNKHEVIFSQNDTVNALDTSKEIVDTLLCYLELDEKKYVKILKPSYGKCKILSYGGHELLANTAKTCRPLKTALGLYENEETARNVLEFPVQNVAKIVNHDVGILKRILKNLEWTNVNGSVRRSGLTVEFSDLSFHLLSTGNLPDEDLDEVLDRLHEKVTEQENSSYSQLIHVHDSLNKASMASFKQCENATEKSDILKMKIREYFESSCLLKANPIPEVNERDEKMIVNDVRSIIGKYSDENFTGRSIARIFHGISSPNFPAYVWGRTKFWRSHLRIHFNNIHKIATKELIKCSTNSQ